MSALAEALLAAQRRAIGAATKAYVAGAIEDTGDLVTLLDSIGATDKIEQGQFLASLDVLRQLGASAPQANGAAPPKSPEAREEREELEALQADVDELRREQEAEERHWTVADVLAEQGAPGWRDALNKPGTSAWAEAIKKRDE